MIVKKITELDEPPAIGESYLVPCVESVAATWTDNRNQIVPIFGDFHWDLEIIQFPEEHVHIDFRFVSRSEFRRLNHRGSVFAKVVSKKFVVSESWEIRTCYRKMPKFPTVNWTRELEKEYKSRELICGKCPHKGMNLSSVGKDRSGMKICPGHGLRWDKQGKLAPRMLSLFEVDN